MPAWRSPFGLTHGEVGIGIAQTIWCKAGGSLVASSRTTCLLRSSIAEGWMLCPPWVIR
jgi:hypothetical protein